MCIHITLRNNMICGIKLDRTLTAHAPIHTSGQYILDYDFYVYQNPPGRLCSKSKSMTDKDLFGTGPGSAGELTNTG